MKPQTGFSVHDDLPSMLDGSLTQELGSTVVQIIKGSRSRAHAMVDAAFKVCPFYGSSVTAHLYIFVFIVMNFTLNSFYKFSPHCS